MPWSFSALSAYESCPYKRKLALEGNKEVESEAILKGHHVHTLAENYLQRTEFLPSALAPWQSVLDELKGQPLQIEQLWGLNDKWQPVDWRDPQCWARIKLDVCVTGEHVRVIDWKTGKKKPIPHAMQGNLYMIAAAAKFPDAMDYRYEFYYLDDTPLISKPFTSERLEGFRAQYERRAERMLTDDKLLPRPNKQCQWCGYNTVCQYSAAEV